MTGGSFIPTAVDEEYDLDHEGNERHSVQWVGTPGVKGPKWARMPLLTVGMLGIQCVWSIEMGYASPYLLELGLSKSWMSLVFVAGPLSGLIVQPLIGIFADRSRSPLGRRRPFMLAGCAISVFAMMLLGWSREVSSFFGGGSALAIGLAVWSIYLIDFSINAVMSTDRALVVDTLPPSAQEEGSAWAGRMFGFGSVAGFFVGNLDLPPVLPFLGKTQLQILSFITSSILVVTHTFTSWGVTERILLRDDRPHSQSSLSSNLRAIWENMFSLPPGIKTVCIIQFCASLGWFPILFFTTLWVSGIYKSSLPASNTMNAEAIASEAVRTGARALLLNSLVNIVTSILLPFLVSESGVQPQNTSGNYTALGDGNGGDYAEGDGTGYPSSGFRGSGGGRESISATWRHTVEGIKDGSIFKRWIGASKGLIFSIGDGTALTLPIKGLTLVKVWWISQFIFAVAMAATWFVKSVYGAYLVIGVTGFCWAIAQWAPYSLLGELILLDTPNRTQLVPIRQSTDLRATSPRARATSPLADPYPETLLPSHEGDTIIPSPTPAFEHGQGPSSSLHSRHSSRSSREIDRVYRDFDDEIRSLSPGLGGRPRSALGMTGGSGSGSRSQGLSPLVIQSNTPITEIPSTVVLHHPDDPSDTDTDSDPEESSSPHKPHHSSPHSPPNRRSTLSPSPTSPHPSHPATNKGSNQTSTADKAGVILGIHNVFLVLPQFIVTLLSSVIFYLMEPGGDGGSGGNGGVLDGSTATGAGGVSIPITGNSSDISGVESMLRRGVEVVARDVSGAGGDGVGLIFRIGGVSAAVGGFICWRMSREWAKGRGV